jgi:UDP-N-acetylglucosamine 3-dehydrogenase
MPGLHREYLETRSGSTDSDPAQGHWSVTLEDVLQRDIGTPSGQESSVKENGMKTSSPQTERLRAAVIGVGARGRNHVRLCVELETVALVGVADPDPTARGQVASRHHIQGFANHRKLVEAEKPDFALLAVPSRWHYPIAHDLIEQGVHVLMETPIAMTAEEGRMLIDRARVCGVKLGVGYVERFNPAVTALQERLQRGELGRVFQISVRRIGGFHPGGRDLGIVLDRAIHDLHVMRYLAGGNVLRVSAELAHELDRPQEDMLCGLLRFDNGIVGLLDVNWLSPTQSHELTVYGQRGMFVANYLTQELCYYENSLGDRNWNNSHGFRGVAEGRTIRYPISPGNPLLAQLEAFVHSILYDKPFPVDGEEGLRAILLAQRLVEAGHQGRSLHLDQAGHEVRHAKAPAEVAQIPAHPSPVL